MRMLATISVAVALPLLTGAASAQEITVQPGQYFIEGVVAYCGDIQTILRTDGPLIMAPDTFRIVLNGPAFDALPVTMRLFAYFQTCGMIFYGDLALADSYAARRGVRDGWLSADAIEAICTTDVLMEAGWAAAPDDARCQAIVDVMLEAIYR